MRRTRARSASQFARLAIGITVGFLALHLGFYFYYAHERMVASALTFAESTLERAHAVLDLEKTHPDVVARLSGPDFEIEHVGSPAPAPRRQWPHSDEVRERLLERLGDDGEVRLWFAMRGGPPRLVMHVADNGRWLRVVARTSTTSWGHSVAGVFWTSAIAVLVWLGVLWATRRVTRYLPSFALAAENLGSMRVPEPLPEDRGPREIRNASRAFNEMQRSVTSQLEQRTRMLAAFSHDLRTLITRLQLRTALIDDESQRDKAEQDIRAVSAILDESLTYARDEQGVEEFTDIDLSSMLQALIDGAVDQGYEASFEGPSGVVCTGQPSALRRAFANLIDNAVDYGGRADVRLSVEGEGFAIDVVDQGPGIPPDQTEAVLEPYVRLEASRSRDTGGTGLGLAIVQNVVARHGGTLAFHVEPDGFHVTVTLPG